MANTDGESFYHGFDVNSCGLSSIDAKTPLLRGFQDAKTWNVGGNLQSSNPVMQPMMQMTNQTDALQCFGEKRQERWQETGKLLSQSMIGSESLLS